MLRQHARYRVLLTRLAQAQQTRQGGFQLQTRHASSGAKRDEDSFIPRMLKGLRGEKKAGKDAVGASGEAAEGALVPNAPELKHRKVFVVELSRKPLFPGIYTPVLVLKNERLIKEVMEAKKHGGQAYVGAFLKRPEKAAPAAAAASDAAKAAAAATTDGGAAGTDGAAAAADSVAAAADGVTGAAAAEGAPAAVEDAAGHLYDVGTFAQVHTILAGDTADSAQLLLLGHRRLKREATLSSDPLCVAVTHLRDEPYSNDDITKATSMEIVNTMKDLLNMNPLYGEQFRTLMTLTGSIDLNDLSRLVDAAASLTSAEDGVLQELLETLNVPQRARLVLELLKKEVELCRLQADIREQVESKIMKEQRRMILMEQLKSIKRELGLERDDKAALIARFQARWEPKRTRAPEAAQSAVRDELDKLAGLEPVSPEFNVTRNYLDWLTGLPWGEFSQEIFDIQHAKQVLDEDHYGLDDVKDRILEFIAVSRLRGSAQGKILCLVGPPGVGKTSIGRSIARTLGRAYYRFSVGGLHDVAEIKGHRRTYVGAMPGKMVQCLKTTGTSNPLVLVDEIDKLGRGHTGDPASALLELLDPEQNSTFLDHYLDVPIDLSKVLFVCTANVLDTIPGPLLDRMEVIRLSGYASDEKNAIARQYLEPQARADAGVPPGSVTVADDALSSLIEAYCREAGVRNLKKHLEKVYRKAALKLVQAGAHRVSAADAGAAAGAAPAAEVSASVSDAATAGSSSEDESSSSSSSSSSSVAASSETSSSSSGGGDGARGADSGEAGSSEAGGGGGGAAAADKGSGAPSGSEVVYSGDPIVIDSSGLQKYVGLPPFAQDRFYEVTPEGVVMGLAWTAMGGATLYVEAAKVAQGEGKGGLVTTGQLGDVMRESATIAHTYARAFLARLDPGSRFFSDTSIHIHVPAGATPKDGPSAGCTIITALLSLALGRPVAPDTAMTGEVTLTGRVLPIGGVKEKLLAARRSGVTRVIFPEGNRRDYEEVAADLRRGVTPHFVSTYDEVFDLALGGQSGAEPGQSGAEAGAAEGAEAGDKEKAGGGSGNAAVAAAGWGWWR